MPTIYTPIDCDLCDAPETYQALRYVEERLWLDHDLLLVNDWYPVIVTNGTIAMAEILHTALCYYRLGDVARGWRLLQSALNNFSHGRVPGTMSQYAGEDDRQGTYTDFSDSSSMFARTVVEGLFGILPMRQDNLIIIQPALPAEWPQASIRLRDIAYEYRRDGNLLSLAIHSDDEIRKVVRLIADQERVVGARLNGAPVPWRIEPGIGRSFVEIDTPPSTRARRRLSP